MDKSAVLVLMIFILFSCNKTDKEILNQTISKLNSLKTIEYQLISKDILKDFERNRIDTAYCYFDFSSKDTLIQSKYQFISNYGQQVFNGTQIFNSLKAEEVVLYTDFPDKRKVVSNIFMVNSIFELRKTIPKLVIDSTAFITRKRDTVINNIECFKFKILMTKKYIGLGGEFTMFDGNEVDSLNYLLFISKKNYLPVQFGTIYPKNNGYRISTYKNLKEITPKNDSIWSYDRMPRAYMRISYSDYFKGMGTKNKDKIGIKAPDWTLPMIQGDSIQLSKIKSNLVLLEFWFPYCTGCVQAIPELNKIHENYKDKGLEIYGIEFTKKSEKILIDYIEKQKIEYPTLLMGEKIAKEYGVYVAPTFFLIDKKGIIIYASVGLNKQQLIKKINTNI
jgi:peroxiredoxin